MRVFHLSHHDGCIADFEYVATQLGLSLTSAKFDDGYNIGPGRADRAWARWRARLQQADVVLTSDTAPLSRIALTHMDEFHGHVIVWVCNRFDYADEATNDCGFPDPGYYELMRWAATHPRVHIVPYTPFERLHARLHGVDFSTPVIRPIGRRIPRQTAQLIPSEIDKQRTVFVPAYHNDTLFMDLAARCERLGMPAFCGRYGAPEELRDFRAMVHIPYSWSVFAFFERLQDRVPMFVPTPQLLLRLARRPNFWWPQEHLLREHLTASEWYAPEHDFLVYFRSWRDLARKFRSVDLDAVRDQMRSFARSHSDATLSAWRELFDGIHASGPEIRAGEPAR